MVLIIKFLNHDYLKRCDNQKVKHKFVIRNAGPKLATAIVIKTTNNLLFLNSCYANNIQMNGKKKKIPESSDLIEVTGSDHISD